MSTDYDKIREDNILEYGQGTRHLSFLGRLYTDRTHFVFELLQNAEDAGATQILFSLFDDRLEVTHDGRPFNEWDVRGVCGVGEGTKTEDLTRIGKFGIGFKSVYSYTATPEIHSGHEGFRIESYVRPYKVSPKPVGTSWTTRFIFPFNSTEISPATACTEIGTRLCNLSARTLLFLRKIKEIEYKLPNATGGVYLREEIDRGSGRQVNVIGQNNGKAEDEKWLIFERQVPVPGDSNTVCVEVSFRLEDEDETGKSPERIVKVKESPLIVYFPTEKDTRFGFLIQGPYRTTPSRDNIPKDDEWNELLVKETAELIVDILPEIKELGLISVSFLEALPIRSEDFSDDSMFYPIVESVRNTLTKEELLPADDGSFVSGENAKLARGADLRKLLSQVQLGQLFQSPATMKWLTEEITQDRTPNLHSYLTRELDVEEMTPDGLARKLNQSFLADQPNEWFVDFYEYLSEHEALWRVKGSWYRPEGLLRRKPIIRCQDGLQRAPFDELGHPIVFLPVESSGKYHVLHKSIYENEKVAEFMQRLGIVAPDLCTRVINDIIPLYEDCSEIEDDAHNDHVSVIADAMGLEESPHYSKMVSALKDTTWALAANAKTGEHIYDKPTHLFLQSPKLQTFFEGNANVWFLAEDSESIDWSKLGVRSTPVINCEGLNSSRNEFVKLHGSHGSHMRGENGFDPNTSIDGLEHALMHISGPKAEYIWNDLLPPLIRFLRGRYQKATRQNYENATTYEEDSKLCKILKNHEWLPVDGDKFKRPSECTIADLVGELRRNKELAEALGVQLKSEKLAQDVLKSEDERNHEHAIELGVSLEDIEFLKNHPDEIEKLKASVAARKEYPQFPSRRVANTERRQERLLEQLSNAPDKEYEKRERRVRTTNSAIDPITWLRNHYTNEAGQMICQICKEEMPFRKRDGTHYFEKKEVLSKKYLPKEHEAQYLALCPLCAAKYNEFVQTDEVMAELRERIIGAKDDEIPISLGDEETSLRFVDVHLHDLKIVIMGEHE